MGACIVVPMQALSGFPQRQELQVNACQDSRGHFSPSAPDHFWYLTTLQPGKKPETHSSHRQRTSSCRKVIPSMKIWLGSAPRNASCCLHWLGGSTFLAEAGLCRHCSQRNTLQTSLTESGCNTPNNGICSRVCP